MKVRGALIAAASIISFSACATTFEGDRPSALYGQDLDAAVALYGPWNDQFSLSGRSYVLWRRKLETPDGPQYCELRLELTPKRQIARRLVQGLPEACALFAVKFAPS